MKVMKKKFYLFGILLTFTVAVGLIIQYAYLNNVITKDKQLNIIKSREHLGYQINSNLKYHSQYTVAASEFIAMNKWKEEEIEEYFKRLVKNNPTIRSIYFGDLNNKLINSDDWNPPSSYDVRERQWYIKAIEEKEIIVSDLYVDALENKLIATISKPIYDQEGVFLGVVSSDISIEKIISIVEDTTIKGLGYSFLIDGAGNIIAHPKYKYEFESELINIESISEGIHNELKITKVGQIEVELDGVKGYLSYQPIEKTDWIIGNFMSLEEFRGNGGDIWRMFFIALGIAIAIFGSFTYLQRVHFFIPVYKLDEDIRNINVEENIGYRMPAEKEDPFVELRKTINQVINKTQEFFEQTEQDTEEIIAQHNELEASYNQLSAMEHELRQQYTRTIESEKELKQALDRNNAIITALPDVLFVITKEGRFIDFQASDKTELYLAEEDFLGKKLEEIFPSSVSDTARRKIQDVLVNNGIESFEYELNMINGPQNYEVRMAKINEDEVIAITRNITERKELERNLMNLSYRDQLTGLYNRRYFEEELRRLDVPRNLPLTLVMADVNGLKLINDSFGHKSGDELLKDIANIIKEGCREDDIIARISGGEFVIILTKTNEIEAENLIKRLKKLSADEKFANDKLSNMELSVSFGIGTKYSIDTNIAQVLKHAEDDMYAHKLFEGPSMRSKAIETIMQTLYEKNKRERFHSARVANVCQNMGIELGMEEDELKKLETIGLLHDIGKIAINEAILDKPGPLTEEEWEDMKKHPEIGYRILSTVNQMSQIAEYVLYHHERYDGLGYPKGLKGDEIPLISRIIAIADAYDAMASDRAYRKALSKDEIVEEFINNSGTQFDPQLAKIFVEKILGREWKED